MKGIFAIYKPKGPTSNDILKKIRRITGIKKVGHAGTLDPLAKGILVVGIEREATKQLDNIVKKEKEYLATIKLGMESTTDDDEGKKKILEINDPPLTNQVEKVVKNFQGEIMQTPPIFSAIKVKGQEAYKLARQGKIVTLKPRKVKIKKIEILNYQWPYLKLKVITGPGVYIRSLARDIGRRLKTGGYLFELERTRVGDFSIKNSVKISELEKYL